VEDKPATLDPPRAGPVKAVYGMILEMRKPRPICVHCQVAIATRRRQLCCRCYADPQVRAETPVKNHFGYRGVAAKAPRTSPAKPSRAQPGSEAKVRVLIARAQRGESLWHAGDFGMKA
jgi:hypothetical protein